MRIIRGTVTTRKTIAVEVSSELDRRIQGFKWAWEMNDDQFLDAMSEHGRVELTAERIDQIISTH